MSRKTFYFNTGVNLSQYPNPKLYPSPNNIGLIPFCCDDVPDNATIAALCDDENLFNNNPMIIKRKIYDHDGPWSQVMSKYAYFHLPVLPIF